ncbi:hypothetical protein H0H87_001786 [Tephrocybe sp. NHM501043]|nr:hypothetical protein H0H87_001786 [Tephrocybe sp. NHM501043]
MEGMEEQNAAAASVGKSMMYKDLAQVLAQAIVQISMDKGPKIADPKKFYGDSNKLDAFLTSIHLIFHSNPTKYTMVDSRITCTLLWMKEGQAGKWAQIMLKKISHKTVTFTSWDKFKAMEESFHTGSVAQQAHEKMKYVCQENHDIEDYIAEFEMYEEDTSYNNMALVKPFQNGIIPKDDDLPTVFHWSMEH